ncbi:Asp23/Gls24 family envelope stress response protein [Arthrobacter psychrolactophilus]
MNPRQDCGRRIEDLSDFLDSGTSADAAHISHCPQCQARLAGLRILSSAALDLMSDDEAQVVAEGTVWLDGMLANLRMETRAGRSIPLSSGPLEELSETEGAVIAMVRAVGDSLGGVLIGRCRLVGDVTVVGAAVEVNINVSARYGYQLPSLAQELRDAVAAELLVHTELNIVAVNVAFTDLRLPLEDSPQEMANDVTKDEQP